MAEAAAADEQQLKQRAMRRLAVALGLIALAIAGLAVLDRYNGSSPATETRSPGTEPPAIAALPPPKPIAPPPNASDSPAAALPPPPPPKVEDDSQIPSRPPVSQPERAPAPASAQKEAANPEKPAPSAPAAKQPATPAAAAPAAPAAAPSAAPGTPAAAAVAPPPTPGYVVQLGMFTNVDNAQGLLEHLKAQGVPAYLETRVVVGPFRDKAEADAAQRKLQAGGIAGVIAQRK
jgi:DedD protein